MPSEKLLDNSASEGPPNLVAPSPEMQALLKKMQTWESRSAVAKLLTMTSKDMRRLLARAAHRFDQK